MSNGKYYIGSTRNLVARIGMHQRGGVSSTKKFLPIIVKYYREYPTIGLAILQERHLKRMKSRKIIEQFILGT